MSLKNESTISKKLMMLKIEINNKILIFFERNWVIRITSHYKTIWYANANLHVLRI